MTQLFSSPEWKRQPLPLGDEPAGANGSKGYCSLLGDLGIVVRPVLIHVRELVFGVAGVVVDLVSDRLCDLARLL